MSIVQTNGSETDENSDDRGGTTEDQHADSTGGQAPELHSDAAQSEAGRAYDEADNREAGVDYRLEGYRGRRARRRAARALKSLDRALVRLAKQVAATAAWKQQTEESLAHCGALADQPTSLLLHIGRKVGVIVAELGFTYAALELAGIPGRNLRMILSVALAGLLVLLGQTIARTMKTAHLASRSLQDDSAGGAGVEPPTSWDWSLAAASIAFLIAFTAALTTIRESYNHAINNAAAAASSNNGQLTVAAPLHTAPGWVLAILALVAPLIAILGEYAMYDPRAHRLRRNLRLFAWNARKLRYILWRCGRPVHRARRALLASDNPRSRAVRMKQVIRAAHRGLKPGNEQHTLDADEPLRQLRDRIRWYDGIVQLSLLEPNADAGGASDPPESYPDWSEEAAQASMPGTGNTASGAR